MPFDGIPLEALDFYEALEADNSKMFWTAHKHVYDQQVKAPLTLLAEELEPEFGTGKLFRPYRDVRFSADKTPYKTSQGVWFQQSGMYLQVGAGGLFLGGGHWRSDPADIARYREAVADDRRGGELQSVVDQLRDAGWEVSGERLTRVPAGYPKDHPRADLLKHKTMTGHRDLGAPDWLSTPQAAPEIAGRWRQLTPLVEWLRDNLS